MIEAEDIRHRRWLYFILRRFELIRWACRKKMFRSQWARLKGILLILSGHETEICEFCGRDVGVVWWCDDKILWETVTGYTTGGGIACVQCFDDIAQTKGIHLRWKAGPLSGYTAEEWQRIIQANQQQFQ